MKYPFKAKNIWHAAVTEPRHTGYQWLYPIHIDILLRGDNEYTLNVPLHFCEYKHMFIVTHQ